jgi:hypothetical protein
MSKLNLTPVNIPAFVSNPATPTAKAGDMYYNSASNSMYYFNGTTWQQFASGSASVPDISNFGWWIE